MLWLCPPQRPTRAQKIPAALEAESVRPAPSLVELMQDINFGRIERLRIADGQPVLNPRPVVIREYKLTGENGSRPEATAADFLLKQAVIELLAFFDARQNGTIDVLEIKHGLPFRLIVTEVPAA